MANPDEIKQRISIEGAEHVGQLLERISELENQLAASTAKTGAEADVAAPKIDRLEKAHRGIGAAIKGSLSSWVSWTTIVTAAVLVIREVISTATEGAKAVADLGRELNGLAVNQGGKVADQTIKDINAIALDQKIDTAGRNQLIGAAGTITDLTPGISQSALHDELVSIARLRRIAGDAAGTGSDTAALLQTAMAKGKLSPQAAADQVGTLLTSGFDQQNLGDLYRRGGPEFIAAVYGARDKGLDLRRSASALPRIMAALDRRGQDGNLDPGLVAAGVTADMSMVQRLQTIQQATSSGKIKPDEGINLMGGYQSMDVTGPLLQAVMPNALKKAQAEIQGTTLNDLEALRDQSNFVRMADRAANRDLRVRLAQENSSLAPGGDAWQEGVTKLTEEGGGSWMFGFLRRLNESRMMMLPGASLMAQNQPAQTHVNIGQQYNMGTDGESPLTRPVEGGLR